MSRRAATPIEAKIIAAITTAAGCYFLLVGVGAVPVPGGPRNLHAPLWIVFGAGAAFFLGGLAVFLQVVGRADADGKLPAAAPRWLAVAQYLIGVTLFATFAAIASFIAFGPGNRKFSGSALVFDAATNAAIGRAAFAIGALLTWFAAFAFAVSGARKLRRRFASQDQRCDSAG